MDGPHTGTAALKVPDKDVIYLASLAESFPVCTAKPTRVCPTPDSCTFKCTSRSAGARANSLSDTDAVGKGRRPLHTNAQQRHHAQTRKGPPNLPKVRVPYEIYRLF